MSAGGGPLARLRAAWRRNILLRLAAGIFLAVALSTAVYTTYVMQTMREEAEQNLRDRAERLAAVLAQALARPLFDINSAAVSSVVDASGATPEVLFLRVLSPSGTELASFVAPSSSPVAAVRVHREISYTDAHRSYPVGALDLAISRQQIDQDLRRQIYNTVAANLLLALAIVLSIFVVMRKTAQPFADIQQALEKLTQGVTDITLSGTGREDQVGRLSNAVLSFRETLTRLRDAELELRELNGDLERRILERTQEVMRSMQMASESQAKLQTIVDTALDAVVRMDLEGRIVGWNRQAEKIFGWSRAEALGQMLDQTIIPARYRYDHRRGMARYLGGGSAATTVLDTRIEVEALRRSGEEFPIELAITQVKLLDQDSFEFCAFIRDISERREREQKLVTANVMAEAANIAKSEFLANMSHEIRTPMSAIIGMAYLALRTDLTPKQHDYVNKIHRAALSLLGIINDILDFSKIEAGRLDIEAIPFQLEDVLANVASVTAQRAADKGLEYLFHVPPGVPRHLIGDPLRLGQVLINLVNNAVKFTAEGELELSCMLVDGAAIEPGKVALRFTVRDTGIGMTAQQQSKLFRAFSQANGSTSRQYGGTGLGLSISQQLVALMGGSIRVESVPEQGSVFCFDLVLPTSGQLELAPALPPVLQQARVLLVDDCPAALTILHEALRPLGLRLDCAAGGPQALAAILAADAEGDPYRLVLSDWQMPDIDGIELARRVRRSALQRAPGMVLVTAFGRDEVQQQAEQAGIIGFLFKPIGQSALADTLASFVMPRPLACAGQLSVGAAPEHAQRYAARVLLVEGKPVNQEIAAELMALQGICVDIVSSGHEALERLRSTGPQSYGLVLMDLELGPQDGHDTVRMLRHDKRFAQLPVIAMTADPQPGLRERCLAEGMQDYLTKPFDPQQLYAALSRWLDHAQMPVADAVPAPLLAADMAQPDAHEAVAQLRMLLAEFSGDSNDYFDSVRAMLAGALGPATMKRLHGHLSLYEFEAASQLLAAAVREMEQP
ncbi:MAG: response regulator [Sphingomonadaceae bacterium]